MKIKRTGSKEYGRYIKALICGEPGSGKTLISSTWPHPLFASAEGGLMSIADRNIPFVEIGSSDELRQLKIALEQPSSMREQMFGFPVETIVIDTIDEVQRILIRERLEETGKDSMQLQDWGAMGEQMKALITGIRNLDMHVIFTCHIKETSDTETGKMFLKPGLQGAIGDQIAGYVDLSLLLKSNLTTQIENNQTVKRLVRHLQTQPDAHHQWIKDRSGKLPPELPVDFDTDYKRIDALIFAHMDNMPDSSETLLQKPGVEPSKEVQPESDVEQRVAAAHKRSDIRPISPEGTLVTADASPPPGVDPETGEILSKPAVTDIDTKMICEDCKGQIESVDQADLSRIKHRRRLCKACHKTANTARR